MKNKLKIVIGFFLGLFLLWLLFRDTNWPGVWQAVKRMDPMWLFISQAIVFISFFPRVWRWKYIVHTAKPVPFSKLFSATQIGFLGNFVLPGRAGELIRALVLSRLSALPISRCIAFVALDRVTDLVGLLAIMVIAALTFHPAKGTVLPEGYSVPQWAEPLLRPNAIQVFTGTMALILFGMVACLVLLYVNQRLALWLNDKIVGVASSKLAEKTHGMLEQFAQGLHIFRSGKDMAKTVALSLVTWSSFILFYYSLMRAFHMPDPPIYAPFVVVTLISIAISLSGAPGFIGQFHVAIILGVPVTTENFDLDVAKAAALVGHILNVIPIAITGGYCLYREKLGLLQLRRESEEVESELE